jgi:hypothetical protein
MSLFKILGQLQYIITNQQEGGRKGRREGGGEVVRSILDCFCEKLTVKIWHGCRRIKDATQGESKGERCIS